MLFLFISYAITVVVAYFIIRLFIEKLEIDHLEKRPILITGCDSGFGKLLALKCLSRGMPVFAGCLTENGVDDLRLEAKKLQHGQLYTIQMDVTNDESVKKAYKYIEQHLNGGGLHAIVNNAGVAGNTLYDDFLTVDDYKNTAEVNTWGVVRVSQTFKPLVKQTRGRIVTIASMLDRISIPNIGPYTVSKYAVNAYCDIIRRELHHFGVSVHTLEPGFFQTAIIDQKATTNRIQKIWERAPESVKEEYGQEFLRMSKNYGIMLNLASWKNSYDSCIRNSMGKECFP
ncbi:hypothetical protein WR25_02576 [Diploscapter pachys]|uniref:Uncharacterized protein n=1 Tax=Diploscapter pachys TaxID=2018661 RepID=A0A2A2L9T2_9BILA|nr:hypothetical protein WR25_02576 [Diploscapter pachys]